jgi:hypothetical protein
MITLEEVAVAGHTYKFNFQLFPKVWSGPVVFSYKLYNPEPLQLQLAFGHGLNKTSIYPTYPPGPERSVHEVFERGALNGKERADELGINNLVGKGSRIGAFVIWYPVS